MKKIIITLVCTTALFVACQGPEGPQGPPGIDGLLGQVFEVQVDFTSPNYNALVNIPSNIEVFNSDIIVAYVLDAVGGEGDVWEPLPQTLFLGPDTLMYSFNHTTSSVNFFIDGTVNPDVLDPIYTDGIVFRVAVIPADFAEGIDLMSLNQVMETLQIKDVQKIQ